MSTAKDQHILQNEAIIAREVAEAQITQEDTVVEIGAGPGNLTRAIASKAKKVLAFEIDERFREDLKQLPKNVDLVYANALKQSWKGYNKVVANIPYALSEPIIWKAIEDEIEIVVMIVGDQFKEILCDPQRKMGYVAQLFFTITPLLFIRRSEFLPQPRTDSWLIHLVRKQQTRIEKIMSDILLRRGKAKNAILYALVHQGKTKNEARTLIEKINIEKKRLEEPTRKIRKEDFQAIEDLLKKAI